MISLILFSGLLAAGLAVLHLFSGKLNFLNGMPRSRWLSAASGISVAYVFVHLLPDLAEEQETIREAVETGFSFLEYHVYLVALVGLATFYGLDRAAKVSRRRRQNSGKEDSTEAGVFWLHVASFSAYNALIGYLLLHRETPGIQSLFFFAFALGLHFIVNDYGLRKNHKGLYDGVGRWILAVAILVGWIIGLFSEISEAALAVLFAFLAGGIILNVLKEEIPEERESSFGAFALGATFYAAILLIAF